MAIKLQTPVTIETAPFTISEGSTVLVMGSCFAQNIGDRLSMGGSASRVYCNPLGVMYNPLSVARGVEIVQRGEKFDKQALVYHNGLWHSMEHHGKFSAATANETLERINKPAISHADYLIITLGTAFVYYMNGRVVANCHKLPEKEFERKMVGVMQVVEALDRVAGAYPESRIIISVSPIRYLRDGLSNNFLSKSTLRLGVEEFCSRDREKRLYFPAYEILIDELRDYRFTCDDMCHPTPQARDYIWERFSQQFIEQGYQRSIVEWERKERRAAHLPLSSL